MYMYAIMDTINHPQERNMDKLYIVIPAYNEQDNICLLYTSMDDLGFTNAFIGTVEGEPEDTACDKVIEKVKEAGFKNVILRPLMVVAGDHANNDMAGDDADSWKSQFEASGDFDSVDCQLAGLGRIAAVEDLYVAHTKAAIDSLGASDDAEAADDSADDAQADDAAETTADTAEADAE